jgi:nucleotide-binding universal stress UspA family protein
VLLASEGRPFSAEALAAARALAAMHGTRVHVLVIARIWGTGLGLPHPGLLPNKKEMGAARDLVDAAIRELEKHGLEAEGQVIGTRRPAKVIVREAERLGVDAIVMGADPRKRLGDWRWSNEPYRVAARAPLPVCLVKPNAVRSPRSAARL